MITCNYGKNVDIPKLLELISHAYTLRIIDPSKLMNDESKMSFKAKLKCLVQLLNLRGNHDI